MHEIPEARVLAKQLKETVVGKQVKSAIAGYSPHSFAWYYGDATEYGEMLAGKTFDDATAFGGFVELHAGALRLTLGEGASLRFLQVGEARPAKHQLLLEFEDGTALCSTIRMYGAIYCFEEGNMANSWYTVAKEALPYDAPEFTLEFLKSLLPEKVKSLSVKAFLATEQRIPGLGNGVLQDILFVSGLHPKRKVTTLSEDDWVRLWEAIRKVMHEMEEQGGRDVETDLFGKSGGYLTALSAKTKGKPCLICGEEIRREAYLGGNIYYCPHCQPL